MSYKLSYFNSFQKDDWNKILGQMEGNQNFYLWHVIKYYSQFSNIINLSFALFEGKKCIAMVALGVLKSKKEFVFSSQFCPEPILCGGINNYSRKKILTNIRQQILDIGKKYGITKYKLFSHPIRYKKNIPHLSSENQFYNLKWSKEFFVHNTVIIDLKTNEEDIWDNFSKYHKKNIKKASKIKFKFYTIDSKSEKKTITSKFSNFKKAHYLSAGKKTRPDSTWDTMKKMILDGDGILFTLNYKNQDISFLYCGVFNKFAWGWSQANLEEFEKDLMPRHLLEWSVIKKLKKMKFKFYEIGERFYQYKNFLPSNKEISISDFKEKFGGKFYPKVSFISEFNS